MAKASSITVEVKIMKLWIVGKWFDCESCKRSWASNGVFSTEQKAIDACITEDYFVAPLVLNERRGDEEIKIWEGCYYPHLETQKEADLRTQ